MTEINTVQRPIRVMQIIARLNVGGAAMHAILLADQLHPPQYESLLVSGVIGPGEGDMRYFADERNVHTVIIPELGRALHPLKDIITLWRLWHLMRVFRPDVVHTHSAKAGFLGRTVAWLLGVPCIVHVFNGHVFHGYFSPMATRFFLFLERTMSRMSDAILTLTEGLREELSEQYHVTTKERITVLPMGFDLSAFSTMPRHKGRFRAAWGIPEGVPLIGIIGRLVPIKNHALFLQAAALVHQQRPESHFVIIGDGELRQAIEAQVDAMGLRSCLTFTGLQRDMPPIYSDLDVVVISSLNEGTPVTIIEAMAAGCAAVCTAVGGVPDLLEGGKLGKLVPSEDAPALAAALLDVLENPPDPAQARQIALEHYGLARLVKDIDALYRKLLAQKRR